MNLLCDEKHPKNQFWKKIAVQVKVIKLSVISTTPYMAGLSELMKLTTPSRLAGFSELMKLQRKHTIACIFYTHHLQSCAHLHSSPRVWA